MDSEDLIDLSDEIPPPKAVETGKKASSVAELLDEIYYLQGQLGQRVHELQQSQAAFSAAWERIKLLERQKAAETNGGHVVVNTCPSVNKDNAEIGKYVVVILDGNAAQFIPTYGDESRPGGWLAAKRLDKAIQTAFEDLDWKKTRIVVRAYANVGELSRMYDAWSDFDNFLLGFQNYQKEFDFINVGLSLPFKPDFTMEKIRRTTNFFIEDSRCCRVVLGITLHSDIVAFLKAHVGDSRIHLIGTITLRPDNDEIISSFKHICFPDLFKERKVMPWPPPDSKICADSKTIDGTKNEDARQQTQDTVTIGSDGL